MILKRLTALLFLAVFTFPVTALGQSEWHKNQQTVKELLPFVSPDADLFLAATPHQILESPLMQLLSPTDEQAQSDWLATLPGRMEWFAILAPNPVNELLFPQMPEWTIADDSGDFEDIELHQHQPLPVFTGAVRFAKPMTPHTLLPWLKKTTKQQYRVETWQGKQAIVCDEENTLCGLQISSTTYIVGDAESLRRGLENSTPVESKMHGWIQQFIETENHDELILATDLTQYKQLLANQDHVDPTIALIKKAQFADARLDLDGEFVVTCNVIMEDEKSAKKLGRVSRGMLRMARIGLNLNAEQNTDELAQPMFDFSIQLLDTVEVQSNAENIVFRLPRPDNWDTIVESYLTYVESMSKRAEAHFQSIADELDAAYEGE